jgi:hypothetical protein
MKPYTPNPLTNDQRIAKNVELAASVFELTGDDREAARRVFSIFRHLEVLAVIASERGDGIVGQLDDELVHRDSFELIAERLGGVDPAPDSVKALIKHIASLSGSMSILCLNLVGEAWLAGVFGAVATWGLADELFAAIEIEELRHAEAPVPQDLDIDLIAPNVRLIEEHIFNVTSDPEFVFPIVQLAGIDRVAELGRDNVETHRASLKKIGLVMGGAVEAIARCGIDATQGVPAAELIELDRWRQSAINLDLGPISNLVDIKWKHPDDELEARVVDALIYALTDNVRLNRTLHEARGEIYQVETPRVAVRRLYDGRELVSSVYVKRGDIAEQLKKQTKRLREVPYQLIPRMSNALKRLAPAPRVAAAVTNTAVFGMHRGTPALVKDEGATISVNIGAPRRRGWFGREISLGVVVDHRCHDGRELGQLSQYLKKFIERGR